MDTKLIQEEVNRVGNELEEVVTDYMVKQKPTAELVIAAIAGLTNVCVYAAFTAWGPEFGRECINRALDAAAQKWKESEQKNEPS